MARAASGSTGQIDEHKPIKRQAIVVVHGQGEQRPMGTIRDFVKVLWQFNPEVRPESEAPHAPEQDDPGRDIWIVPDDKGGLFELQRITTPLHKDRKTDFFELYYADLLNDTPLRNLWRWMRRLLWIDPTDVPGDLRGPWTVFWVFSLIAVALFWVAALSLEQFVHTDWLAVAFEPRAHIALGISAVALIVLLLPKFFYSFGFLGRVPLWAIVGVFAGSALWTYAGYPAAWAMVLLLIEFYLARRFLLPYFGDAASYLSAQTETVQSRQSVRNRGLRLLRALHDDPAYDRIVVVAHSLGTVLAYDILHILWRQVGPTKDNPPDNAEALKAVDAFVASREGKGWTPEDVTAYQALQWTAFNHLRQQKPVAPKAGKAARLSGWKVSDFVALGSPLASAQFLIAEGREDLDRMKQQRVLPTAPPESYNSDFRSVYKYKGHEVAHHAAVFSTVRWTNIYDPFSPYFFLFGDPISGPVSGKDRFGEAIRDEKVEIHHSGIAPRFFTHSYYWTETSPDWTQPADHIKTLRKAVGIDRLP